MLIILTLPFVAHIKMSAARDIFRRHFLHHPENIPLAVGALFGGLYGVYSLCRLARNHHTSHHIPCREAVTRNRKMQRHLNNTLNDSIRQQLVRYISGDS